MFNLLKDRVAVIKDVNEEKTLESGFILPAGEQDPPQTGVVYSIGDEVTERIKIGTRVMFGKHDGVETPAIGGQRYLILREDNIWLKYDN